MKIINKILKIININPNPTRKIKRKLIFRKKNKKVMMNFGIVQDNLILLSTQWKLINHVMAE
jgi:hypothetical protein